MRHIMFTETFTEEAVLWDGSASAWSEIHALEWDDCAIDPGEPGVMHVYGYAHKIPTGHWVFVGQGNRLDWIPVDEAKVVDAPLIPCQPFRRAPRVPLPHQS